MVKRARADSIDPPKTRQLVGKDLANVGNFVVDDDSCWYVSADFDYAIWKIPLIYGLEASWVSRKIYVFGLTGLLSESKFFYHAYSMLSLLSTPGLSGSAIVCTERGIPVGYLGGG